MLRSPRRIAVLLAVALLPTTAAFALAPVRAKSPVRVFAPPASAAHRAPPPIAAAASAGTGKGRVSVEVDLGNEGEPSGVSRLNFTPQLDRSDFILLNLRVPLGMLIEETDDGTIVVDGAMPGYSSDGQVEPGDIVRAVTAYRQVLAGAPMWQQLASYTPVGKLEMRRLIFRTEGATFADVRDAIASHRVEEGGNGTVTLLVERAVNASAPLDSSGTPRDVTPPKLEPLADVVKRDLQKKRVEDDLTKQVEKGVSAAERTRRLLELGFDVKEEEEEERGER